MNSGVLEGWTQNLVFDLIERSLLTSNYEDFLLKKLITRRVSDRGGNATYLREIKYMSQHYCVVGIDPKRESCFSFRKRRDGYCELLYKTIQRLTSVPAPQELVVNTIRPHYRLKG